MFWEETFSFLTKLEKLFDAYFKSFEFLNRWGNKRIYFTLYQIHLFIQLSIRFFITITISCQNVRVWQTINKIHKILRTSNTNLLEILWTEWLIFRTAMLIPECNKPTLSANMSRLNSQNFSNFFLCLGILVLTSSYERTHSESKTNAGIILLQNM